MGREIPHIRHITRPAMHADGVADMFEDWLTLVLKQLIGPQQLLFTRQGRLFGVSVGWHVYTHEGFYVGSFETVREAGVGSEVYSVDGRYLGERDVRDRDRLATDLGKRHLRCPRRPRLPKLPVPRVILHSVRDSLPELPGWCDFPPFEAFAEPEARGLTWP